MLDFELNYTPKTVSKFEMINITIVKSLPENSLVVHIFIHVNIVLAILKILLKNAVLGIVYTQLSN